MSGFDDRHELLDWLADIDADITGANWFPSRGPAGLKQFSATIPDPLEVFRIGDKMSAFEDKPEVPSPKTPHPDDLQVNLPRDRATFNAWYRSLYATDPVIATAIDFHASSLNSCFALSCDRNEKAKKMMKGWWNEWFEGGEFSLHGLLRELWLIGEVIVTSDLDSDNSKWEQLKIQNPDYVNVKRTIVGGESILSLRPDQRLRDAILNKPEKYAEELSTLDKEVIEAVRKGDNIPLNPFYSSILVMKASPYEIRGTSILQRALRRIIDVGSDDDIVKQTIMYPGLNYRHDGTIMVELIRNKYKMVGNMVADWIVKKVFAPICKLNDLYEYQDGEKVLILPEAKFNVNQVINSMLNP